MDFASCPYCNYGRKEDPKPIPKQPKPKKVSFDLSPEEYERLRKLADKVSLSLRDYIKIMILKKIN